MAKRLIAQVDMDGTLVNYDEAMRAAMIKLAAPGENIEVDLEAAGHGRGPEYLKARERLIKNQKDYWRNLGRLEVGFEILWELELAGFEIHILTKGPPHAPNAWTEKFLWAREHVPHAKVTITEDKSTHHGTVLFDDWPPYVEAWLEHNPHGVALMLDHPYNRDFNNPRVLKIDQQNPDIEELRALLVKLKGQ